MQEERVTENETHLNITVKYTSKTYNTQNPQY